MTKQITRTMVAEAVAGIIESLACDLGKDVYCALQQAAKNEECPSARVALNQLCQNAAIAHEHRVPLCQDCGYVWVCLEIGPDVVLEGDVFADVNNVVAQCYEAAHLRMSMVCDAFCNRANSTNNTPAFCDVYFCDEPGRAQLHVMLKGGGSDNASRVVMLEPGLGRQGIIDAVVSCVQEKGANACPPLTVGVGIGSTFDKVGNLAKRALLRPLGTAHADKAVAEFEEELLRAVNDCGVGAAGLGGNTTALAVHIQTAPCHIAALPVAINLGCNSLRRVSIDLFTGEQTPKRIDDAKDFGVSACDTANSACDTTDCAATFETARSLTLPLQKEDLRALRVGDVVYLSGVLYTLRDAGHIRLLEELNQREYLPYHLEGQTIFYCGPSPAAAGQPFGACGPTTASRMDFAAPRLYDAGVVATIGKGKRSQKVSEACQANSAVYFTCTGGAAALLAQCVVSEELIAYEDLGPEALRRLVVKDFPCVVAFDAQGNSMYE